MEDKKQSMRKIVTYDFSKVIKNIEVSPAFILVYKMYTIDTFLNFMMIIIR